MNQLDFKALLAKLKPRATSAYKNMFGHVLIIGGDYGYAGAPVLAALGALRVGAGLVTIASHKETFYGLNATHPEIMTCALERPEDLDDICGKATVMVLGPGLGRSSWSEQVYKSAISKDMIQVVDADALFYLAQNVNKNHNRVLTPHPGEASMLLRQDKPVAREHRTDALTKMIDKYGGTIILKGAHSLIGNHETEISECAYGNPGMASGGMGDLLSGVIAGLVAQDLTLENAAKLGVAVHSLAGDEAGIDGQRGLLATDLLKPIRKLIGT